MLKKTMEADGRNWDQLLPFVLFAIREVPQASTGFSPFELLYGRRPRGLLDLAKEAWEQQPSPHRTMVEHVEEVRERMATIWPMVREHMAEAQTAQARVYNRGVQPREFAPGDKVLVLVPTSECKFLAKWNGPYEVIEKVGAVNYRVAVKTEPVQVPMGEQLTPSQRQDLQDLVNRNRDVFSAEAGHTDLIQHRIVTEPGKRVKLRPYRIPEARREAIAAELAHTHLLGAHLGVEKTLERIKTRFYWPGVKKAVEDYCRSCPDCQQVAPRPHMRSPLIPLPIISVPFSRIGMDLVGPLPRSSRGHQYILVMLDYATRYPEAIPLRSMATKGIARELMLLFSRVGLPEEILTDQGTPFMSRIMRDLCQLMKVTQLRTSVYHPQTDGLVERFN
ncbi:hypothetical protein SKAU_G00283480 [Synaphobranchus kaupii]|uniref:Gypsy retrotransposon integrase-like protein 1 n=1 Tax=Synaphobranchus kaupii TaxID=118154 RepID=A0A9Q1EXN1_SYNKA|nr:hypothetical protein SKAU_G00283480 [Synaphobranchus kaupii]